MTDGSGLTRRDGSGVTRRDGSDGGGLGSDGSGGGWAVPPGLRARFGGVRQLATSGAEADVFVGSDAEHGGREVVLKVYRAGLDIAESSVGVVAGLDPARAHVVGVLGWGQSDGRWFEVEQFCQFGSLAELADRSGLDVGVVIGQLAAALSALHGGHVVHKDLKPGNVLIRGRDPLDLAVCDFGVSRLVGGTRIWTTGAGTAEYSPPEAAGGEASAAWDWWSLGMVVAELALGRHPLALPDGSMPSFHVVRSFLAQRDVDVSGIIDPRVRLLCAGLLTRDSADRWGGTQVAAWLAGDSPAVVAAPSGDGRPAGGGGRSRVRFGGVEFDTPTGLAAAFADWWETAGSALFAQRDRTLRDDLTAMLREHSLFSAISTLEAQRSGRPDNALARLLLDMDPQLTPQVDRVSVTPAGAEQIAAAVLTAGTATEVQARVCSLVVDADLLRVWRHLPGMDGAGEAGDRVNTITAELKTLGEQFTTNSAVASSRDAKQRWDQAMPVLRAWTVLLAVNPQAHQTTLTQTLAGCDRSAVTDQTWWTTYTTNPGTPAGQLRALITHPIAAADQTAQQAQRQADQAAKAAAQQAAAKAERERERRADQLRREAERARWLRTRNSLIRWLIAIAAISAVVLLVARSCGSTSGGGAPVDRAAIEARSNEIDKMEALEKRAKIDCPDTNFTAMPQYSGDWHWQVLPQSGCHAVAGYLDGQKKWDEAVFSRLKDVRDVVGNDAALTVVAMYDKNAYYPPQPDLFIAGLDTSSGRQLWRWTCPTGFDLKYFHDITNYQGVHEELRVGCEGDYKDGRATISGKLNTKTGKFQVTSDGRATWPWR